VGNCDNCSCCRKSSLLGHHLYGYHSSICLLPKRKKVREQSAIDVAIRTVYWNHVRFQCVFDYLRSKCLESLPDSVDFTSLPCFKRSLDTVDFSLLS